VSGNGSGGLEGRLPHQRLGEFRGQQRIDRSQQHQRRSVANDAKGVMQQAFKPVKVLEDSANRFWYEYVPPNNSNGKTRAWYVGIPLKGNVCGAQITMKDGNEALAKTIAMSVKPK
jgi:hypothetical protein